MMTVVIDIFETGADVLVNPVNCVGVAGAGLALEFRTRFPDSYLKYKEACASKSLKIGRTFLDFDPPILYFPTKSHWKHKSTLSGIRSGLNSMVRILRSTGFTTVAVPKLGCGLGGLDWKDVRPMIVNAFTELPDMELILCE